MPRYAILIKATPTTEGKGTAAPETLSAVAKFNEEMHSAGILLGGEGLRPTSEEGYRLRFSDTTDKPELLLGPFDLQQQSTISGWWLIQVKNAEEALDWATRIPFRGKQNAEVELRRVSELADFSMTEGQKKREIELRKEIEKGIF
ncbi:hypothetical protein B0I35DRAFT_170446 [Stachybotrys elegans]|uniref:YCII-related domain-containing protein n=1 Tax=Stachybotrys elegans TaxID=80388 RepID=A0A8K0SWS5_9HYPO|nr:hypothetical protein B0I35DRAFT_170446 [Stachybotrys elegans]